MAEQAMKSAPGHIRTEPMFGESANTLSSSPITHARQYSELPQPPSHPVTPPPAPSPNQRPIPQGFATATLPLVPNTFQAPSGGAHDVSATIEQLRNDVFGIAMSVSALSDRIDRLEQNRQGGATLDTLRGEIQTWLENHLNSAVEHCMHRIISRNSHSQNHPSSSLAPSPNPPSHLP